MRRLVSVIGASGFIGRHLVSFLANDENYFVRVFSRNRHVRPDGWKWPANVEVIQGDLTSPSSLDGLLETGCTVVNLAYFKEAGEKDNLLAVENILQACQRAKVARLIHFSTADVSGRVTCDIIDESTVCTPFNNYGRTKLKIEDLISDNNFGFDRVILRPTAVYGPGGANLRKLLNDLLYGNQVLNYLKLCLFGQRRMHLVNVKNVVGATVFLINDPHDLKGQVFLVSDDDDPQNNFQDVEQILISALGCPRYSLRPIRLPFWVLSVLLRALGKNNVNPACNYSQKKLEARGFVRFAESKKGLAEYADWYSACQRSNAECEIK